MSECYDSHLLEEFRNKKTGEIFIFSSAFNVFRKLARTGQNPNAAFNDLGSGNPNPDTVLNVLSSTMIQIKDKKGNFTDVNESEARELTESFIQEFGFMETSFMAQHIISKLMIGDEKKYKGAFGQKLESLMISLTSRSRWMNLLALGSLWATTSMIFGGLGCWIFSNSGMFG